MTQGFLSSSVVEQTTVNRLAIGSNPIWGEGLWDKTFFIYFLFHLKKLSLNQLDLKKYHIYYG